VVEGVMATAPGSAVPILRGIQFALRPGEVLAVVGPSASGKTTLARLLVGIWPALSGKVRLDGADVFTWDKAELGPHIGYLPQGVELLEGTLAENISRFGAPDPAKVEAAARAVGLHEYILGLPQGYDSPVGREGAILSGGQRQRVALARAIYADPVLVVLDEPNSSLDEAGDAALAAAILQLKGRGTTFVVMTHRTSVLAVVDKMLVLRDGNMQAFGPRDEVLAALVKAAEQAGSHQTKPAVRPRGLVAPAA
jgi:ATP-binding cassette subfamily C exporter for protease/lipase